MSQPEDPKCHDCGAPATVETRGHIPGQGYSATLTEYEMAVAKGLDSLDSIIAKAEGN